MPSATLFATFYSFKGGVGRSLTLVNTAVELTRQGHQVIIWDMDIEAPGIQHIPYFEKITGSIKTGFVDIAQEFIKNDCKTVNYNTLHTSIITHPDNPKLRLFPTGNLENPSAYSQKFASLQWNKLFGKGEENAPGIRLFETLRQELLQYHADFVLIDSRTGFTDTGGVCCFRLPDVVFLVFGYGSQQRKSIQGIYNSLTNRDWLKKIRLDRPLKTFLIASMIPTGRPDLRKTRREQWSKNQALDFRIHVEIPFNEEMAFNETVWPSEYPDHEFCRYYSEIAKSLVVERENLPRETVESEQRLTGYAPGLDRDFPDRPLDPDAQFEQDTAQLFRLMGYDAEVNKSLAGSQIDIFLTKKDELVTDHFIVECKHWQHNVDKPVVDEVENNLKAVKKQYPNCRALIAAKTGFTRQAKEYAADLAITLRTYDELLRGIINFDRYISYIKTLYAGTELEKNYIAQEVLVENTDQPQPLLDYAAQWLAEPQGGFFTLLGDFGTGKTSFTKRLAHDLAIKFEKDKTGSRIPVRIDLKDVAKALGLENIIFDHFSRTANMNVSPEAFLHLLKAGKIMLIFDGFDEMASQGNEALTMKNFQELNKAFGGEAKILLTCRTHYFKDRAETETTLKADKKGLSDSATQLYRAIQGKQGYSLGYLREFGLDQIEEYLQKTLPDSWQEAAGFIHRVYNLKDLASRPVLLDMIVKSLPAIKARPGEFQAADLYAAYVQSWIERDDWRHELTREGREFLVEELARRTWDQDSDRVHYTQINQLLGDFLKEKKDIVSLRDVECASTEVRTASFLTRDDQGNYGFAHRSFQEYFLARGLAGKIKAGDFRCLDTRRLSREVVLFLARQAGPGDLVKTCRSILGSEYRQRISENSLVIFYWTLRYMHAPDGVIKDVGALKALFASDQYRPEKIMLGGAQLAGGEFSYMDFSGAHLEKANLKAALLIGASFRQAVLNGADLSLARFEEADLSGVQARQTSAHHASFKKARLAQADFSDADLHAGNFMDADMREVQLTGCDLSGAGLLRAEGEIEALLADENLHIQTFGIGRPGTGLEELQPVVQLGHVVSAFFAAFSPDGRFILSGGYNHTLTMWDTASGRLIRTLYGHTGAVSRAAFSPDGHTLVSTGEDRTLKLWDAASGREVRTLSGHSDYVTCAAFAPDGLTLVSASADSTLKLWDAASGREIRTLTGHSGWVTCAAFAPVGKTLVSASADKTLKLWDAASGKEIRTLTGHSDYVSCAAFSPDGFTLVSACSDKSLKLWEVASGREIRTLTGHSGRVTSAAFSPDGFTLVSTCSDKSLKLWEVASGREIRTLTGHSGGVASAAFSPDGLSLVSACYNGTLKLWNLASGKECRDFTGYNNRVMAAAIAPDGHTLVSASIDKTLKLWDAASGREIRTLTGHSNNVMAVAFSPDGHTLVSASEDKTLKLWDAAAGREIHKLGGHSHFVAAAAFAPDGRTLVSASWDKTLKLWDVGSGREIRTLTGHSDRVWSAAFAPNGLTLVSASEDKTLKLWDVPSGKEIRTLTEHSDRVTCAAFSPDGQALVSASLDKTLKLWDVASGRKIRTLTGHYSSVMSAAFAPDGQTLVSTSWDNSVRLWEAHTEKEIASLKNLPLPHSVCFSQDGKHLCVGTEDGMVLLDIKLKGKKIQGLEIDSIFYHLPDQEWLVLKPGNRFACSAGGMAYLYFSDQLALYPAADFPELRIGE